MLSHNSVIAVAKEEILKHVLQNLFQTKYEAKMFASYFEKMSMIELTFNALLKDEHDRINPFFNALLSFNISNDHRYIKQR